MVAPLAGAMGLGELHSSSFLGQPLQASVPIVSDDSRYGLEDIRVKQLSLAEARALGIDLAGDSPRLGLKLVNKNGLLLVDLVGKGPVDEPFLNILLELKWPTGTVYREYTLLLDPPSTIAQAVASNRLSADVAPNSYTATSSAATRQRPVNIRSGDSAYRVQIGDSLSRIAGQLVQGSQYTSSEMMRWLLVNNPGAFVAGDMNRIMAGKTLTLPVGADLEDLGRSELGTTGTHAEGVQNKIQLEAKAPIGDQTATPVVAPSPPEQTQSGASRLTIFTPEDKYTGAQASAQSLASRIAQADELAERLRRENEALHQRLFAIENSTYLNSLEQLLLLKEQQVTKLRQQLDAQAISASTKVPTQSRAEDPGQVDKNIGTAPAVDSSSEGLLFTNRWWWMFGLMVLSLIGAGYFFVRWQFLERKSNTQPQDLDSGQSEEALLLELDDIIAQQDGFIKIETPPQISTDKVSPPPKTDLWKPLASSSYGAPRRSEDVVKNSIREKTSNYVQPEVDEFDRPYHDELDILISEAIDAAKRGAFDVAESLLVAERTHQAHMPLNDRLKANSRLDLGLEVIYQLREQQASSST